MDGLSQFVKDTIPATLPGTLKGLTATANGQTQIDLSWSAPASDGWSPITGYRIEVSADGSAWSNLEAATGTTATSYSHSGLMAGSTRHYRVWAINSAGTGPASNVATGTTATEVPGAPTGLTTEVSEDEAKVDLSWTAPTFTGGAPITGYRIESSTDGNDPWTVVFTTTSEGTTYTDDGTDANGPMFSAGNWPHYRVAEVNRVGTGPFSEPRPVGGDPLIARYGANNNGTIEKSEVIKAINDYLFDDADEAISKAEVIKLINLYLFVPSTPHNRPGAPEGLTAAENVQTRMELSWSAPPSDGGAAQPDAFAPQAMVALGEGSRRDAAGGVRRFDLDALPPPQPRHCQGSVPLSSTSGLLSLLGARDNRKPSYSSFSLDTLRSLPVPDFAALGAAGRDLLSSWFGWLQNETLQPFPRMHEDSVRQRIDDAVTQALGLDPEWVVTMRRELAREPSVTDGRHGTHPEKASGNATEEVEVADC